MVLAPRLPGKTVTVPSHDRIDVVLPCLNEAAALVWVLSRMPEGYRPIVADNDSTDGSADIAAAHGALVVQVPQQGFGAACAGGLQAATADITCIMDADASLDPAQLPDVAAPILAGRADLILGRRRPDGNGAWPLHARAANAVLAWQLRRHIGYPLRDIGPMRAARTEPLRALPLTDRRFGYPLQMVTTAAGRGWRIGEVEIRYRPRIGRSKVTGTILGTARAVRDMRKVLADVPNSAPDAAPARHRQGTDAGPGQDATVPAPDK